MFVSFCLRYPIFACIRAIHNQERGSIIRGVFVCPVIRCYRQGFSVNSLLPPRCTISFLPPSMCPPGGRFLSRDRFPPPPPPEESFNSIFPPGKGRGNILSKLSSPPEIFVPPHENYIFIYIIYQIK